MVEKALKPILRIVEENGRKKPYKKPSLHHATAGAYHCTMLADVFSFITMVNMATEDSEYKPYFNYKQIEYFESSRTQEGKKEGKDRYDGKGAGIDRTFKCLHFRKATPALPPHSKTIVDFVEDASGVVQMLYDEFLEFLSDDETGFKIKVRKFFEEYYVERLSDNFHNDIDDELLFVLLEGMKIPKFEHGLDAEYADVTGVGDGGSWK